tara:strand:+ start:66 stop:1142 length:1077 start_codon:yes stop_codon:yes gene_type:complete
MRTSGSRTTALLAFLLLAAAPALAQEGVRIQGQDIPEETAPAGGDFSILLDFREEMRKLVQSISSFAKRRRRNFLIIPENGLDLLIKRDDVDEEKISPARTYMRSIDGILHTGVIYGDPEFGKPPSETRLKELLMFTETAKKNGLKVLLTDFAKSRGQIDGLYRRYAAKGYVPLVSNSLDLNSLPPFPGRPFRESPFSVLSLKDVRNFLILLDTSGFGRQDEFALKMHQNNYDVVIVDIFHGREPLSRQAVETLKYKKVGARRLVLAHIDIGAAASYRYYWQPRWREGSPLWINAPFRGNPDSYYVQYWSPEWQRIISGDNQSYIYGAIDQGFDGVVLGGLESYRFFEGATEDEEGAP